MSEYPHTVTRDLYGESYTWFFMSKIECLSFYTDCKGTPGEWSFKLYV